MSGKKGLNAGAYKPQTADKPYEPYVQSMEPQTEFSIKSVSLGIVFGIVFGAANAYLGLVAGLTISTSIPIAVMTVAAFRVLQGLGRKGWCRSQSIVGNGLHRRRRPATCRPSSRIS